MQEIKTFILTKGDRDSYSSTYTSNPHYSFPGFEGYLVPEIGAKNPNSDPAISGFNSLYIRDVYSVMQNYVLMEVRKGDLSKSDISKAFYDGMKEDKVYLINPFRDDIEALERNIGGYITNLKYTLDHN